jgi:hypothetical protein
VTYTYMHDRGFEQDGQICRMVSKGWTARSDHDLQYERRLSFRIGFGAGAPYRNGLVVATNLATLYKFVRYEAIPKLRPFL